MSAKVGGKVRHFGAFEVGPGDLLAPHSVHHVRPVLPEGGYQSQRGHAARHRGSSRRASGGIVGLLQLNDRRKDRFTLEQIHFFEGISASIGVALTRKQQEDALRESEARHRLLFDGSRDAMMTLAPPSWKFTSANSQRR